MGKYLKLQELSNLSGPITDGRLPRPSLYSKYFSYHRQRGSAARIADRSRKWTTAAKESGPEEEKKGGGGGSGGGRKYKRPAKKTLKTEIQDDRPFLSNENTRTYLQTATYKLKDFKRVRQSR